MDVCHRVEFDPGPNLRSSNCLERGLWSSRLVSIESSIRGNLASQGDRIGRLDSFHGCHPRLFSPLCDWAQTIV